MQVLKKYFKKPPRETVIIYTFGIGILLTAFLILYVLYGKSLTQFVTDKESFKQWLDTYKGLSGAVFVFIRAFQTVIKIIPAEPLEIAAGYAFGTWGGLALCSLGTFLGSLVIMVLSKRLGGKFISAFINEEQLENISLINNKKHRRLFLFLFYLIPSTPKDIMTYAAGSLQMNMAEFFLITSIARIPSILTSTVCGAQLEQNNITAAVSVFIATALVSVLCALIYKKQKGTNSVSERS